MMPEKNDEERKRSFSDIAKIVIASLGSMIIAGATAWLLLARDVATKHDVIQLMRESSPYVLDRELLRKQIDAHDSTIRRLVDIQTNLLERAAKIDAKMEVALDELGKIRHRLEQRFESRNPSVPK